jgi:hypothetical protein
MTFILVIIINFSQVINLDNDIKTTNLHKLNFYSLNTRKTNFAPCPLIVLLPSNIDSWLELLKFNKGACKPTPIRYVWISTLQLDIVHHQSFKRHYYQIGVQFISLNHYGTLKVK